MRYIRQEKLDFIQNKQTLLEESKILIIGAGALGSVVCDLLIRSGITNLKIIDFDKVSLLNLQRQLFFEEDIGKLKTRALKKRLLKINSKANINIINDMLKEDNYKNINCDCDLILDCTDNMEARQIINKLAKFNNKKWVYAAASKSNGNVLIVEDYEKFSKIFNKPTIDRCEDVGVLNTIIFTIASIQVTQAIKILTNQKYFKGLIKYDIWKDKLDKLKW